MKMYFAKEAGMIINKFEGQKQAIEGVKAEINKTIKEEVSSKISEMKKELKEDIE